MRSPRTSSPTASIASTCCRTIARSATYQRSFATHEWNQDDDINYSHAAPRRLQAEQLYDAIMVAAGAPLGVPGAPAGFRASQLPDASVAVPFLDMFGRAPRESPCECERSSEVSLAQTLTLINGPTISEAIAHPQGLIARLVEKKVEPAAATEEIYLSVLNRTPHGAGVDAIHGVPHPARRVGGRPGSDVGADQQPGVFVQPVIGQVFHVEHFLTNQNLKRGVAVSVNAAARLKGAAPFSNGACRRPPKQRRPAQ